MAVKHIVLFQFKKDVTQQQIDDIYKALAGLQALIPGIEEFIGGPYSSPEGMNKEYSHGFVMTFRDAASRDAYLPHPDHEKVKGQIIPLLDDVVAFDFEV
jgi:hypothetical protein